MRTDTRFEGEWRRLANLSADRKGSIHDDEPARKLGFQGAFVPGSTVATATMPALVALLGAAWLDSGWCEFKFVSPVYTSDLVREEAEVRRLGADVRIVTSEGRLCCAGRAGLGFEEPWDRSIDGSAGSGLVLPGVEVGTRFDETEMIAAAQAAENMLRAAGDSTGLYAAQSRSGPARAPVEIMHNLALQVTRSRRLEISGVLNPGMWAEHWLTWDRPLFQERPYRFREFVADKGVSGRTAFLTYEYEVLDSGAVAARGRHRVKWLREG
jgi:hypothetical protein